MQDALLIKKISEEVNKLCKMYRYKKLNNLVLTVNENSQVNEKNLYKKLHQMNKSVIGDWTRIQILYDDIREQTAILQSFDGEKRD